MKASSSASGNNDFRPCPAGVTQGILVDIIDLGKITSTYNGETKTSHKVNFVWQVDERRDDQKRFLIYQRLTLSLHPKANLRRIVDTLKGVKMTDEEATVGVELDDLLGKNALLTLIQNKAGDRIYTNVEGVAPLMKNLQPLEAEEYERRAPKASSDDDDSIPF
jgi:hypothetical protein